MSGHSKWSTIKHKKAKEDAKRGKIFTKLIREITTAAREGGGSPEGNAKLRMVLEKAKRVNMPQDNVARAIKKGTGDGGGAAYEASLYEGYGPLGTAVMIETLTDNRNRTVAELRNCLGRSGGTLADSGSVAWMFKHRGVVRASGNATEDAVIEQLLEYDIDDISVDDGLVTIVCDMGDLEHVKRVIESMKLSIESAQIEWLAKDPISLEEKDKEEKVVALVDQLEDLDDVQNVYVNLG